jgi:predicted ATP-grasp superfamily ATP-dependent carboligase
VSLIAKNRRRLAEGFCFCIPSDEVVEALLDKRREIELMIRLQVPIPKSVGVLPGKAEELGQALELPTIVKPRSFAHKKLLRSKNIVLRTLQELELFYASHRDVLWGLVAQEAIPGDDTMLCKCDCTFNRSSEMVEAFTFRKLRTAPSHFGVASFAISETNREVVELAERIGRALRYVGPVNIEFKFDHRDQQYKYIEMNPRLGLCNYFGTVCGVNNAWNTYRLALGEDLPPQPRQQRDGTVYCCLFADLYARVKDGEPVRSIALHYLSYWDHPHAGPYHAWRDPMPGVVTTCRELGKLGRGVARRVLAPIQRQLGGGRR